MTKRLSSLFYFLCFFLAAALAAGPIKEARADLVYPAPQILAVDTSWHVYNSDAGDQVVFSTIIPSGALSPGAIVEMKIQAEISNWSGLARAGTFIVQYGWEPVTVLTANWPSQPAF